MKHIKINSISIQNFKGIKDLDVAFTENTLISGRNAAGKTTIVDAVMWCLFDKDSSGNSKFEIRTLDSSGNKIHHTEIVVTLVIAIDGTEYELKKIQKEKWVKKRGQETQEFSGNQNVYEVNGFPKSDKEYKAFIAEIVDEDIFKILTNPMTFTSMDWKKQRELLMRFVSDVTPEEVAKSVDNFDLIASDISVASVDDCKKKYSKARKELTDQQKTIPVRIDELEKSKVDVDEKSLRQKEKELQTEIDEMDSNLKNDPIPDITVLNESVQLVNQKMKALEDKANAERIQKLAEVRSTLTDLRSQRRQKMDELNRYKNLVADYLGDAHNAQAEYDRLGEEFKEVKAQKFDESQNICHYCGQSFPESKQEENRKRFIAEQERRKAEINAKAIAQRDKKRQAEDNARTADAQMKQCNAAVIDFDKTIEDVESEESALATPVPVSGTDEYIALTAEMDAIKQKINDRDALVAKRAEREYEIRQKREELNAIRNQIAVANNNANINARISHLRMELKDVSAKLAQSDQLIYVLENYVKFLAQKINERFDGLEFKLFENQINGGIKETCEITVNGVPYSSLNSGHRIVAGLEIIKTLQELYDTKAPVFIDNSETLNDSNMPEMDCQTIRLQVTTDKELKIS